MRKILLLITFVSGCLFATQAQENETSKKLMLGGNLGIEIAGAQKIDGKKNGTSNTSFEIAPSLFYFLSDKMAVGGQIGLAIDVSKTFDDGNEIADSKSTTSMFTIEPMFRYYFANVKRFHFFAQTGLELGFGTNITTINWGIAPGISYRINDKFSLEFSMGNLFGLAYTKIQQEEEHPTDPEKTIKVPTSNTDFGLFVNNSERIGSNPYSIGFAPLKFAICYSF